MTKLVKFFKKRLILNFTGPKNIFNPQKYIIYTKHNFSITLKIRLRDQ